MLGIALQQICHGLEATVGVPRRAGAFTRPELGRTHVVEKEERVDERQRRGGEGAANDEPIAFDGALGPDQTVGGGS